MLSDNEKFSVFFELDSSKMAGSKLEFQEEFEIIKGPISRVIIVTDSQSCLNRINQRHLKGRDDALTESYIRTEAALQRLRALNLPPGFVSMQWVHSHDDSMFNDAADGYAKAAALIVRYLSDSVGGRESVLFAVNKYIGLQTIKREAKALVTQSAYRRWNDYCDGKKGNTTKQHLWNWKIPKKRMFEKELRYFNLKEQKTRLMLFEGALPLNYWKQQNGRGTDIDGGTDCCEQPDCEGNYIPETMYHFIAECPKYEAQRRDLKEVIDSTMGAHNRMSADCKDVKFVEYIEDWNEEDTLKQIIFPSKNLALTERITILKALIHYVERTGRFASGE